MSKYTRKGEIERVLDWMTDEFGAFRYQGERESAAKALNRFGKKERTEARRNDIAASTERLAMAERARKVINSDDCPATNELRECPVEMACNECVARYILGES